MADITEITIPELETASSITSTDLMEIAKVNSSADTGYDSKKISATMLGNFVAGDLEYQSDLQTTAKTLIGAINELKAAIDAL